MRVVVATVAPIFGLIALGLVAARFKWLSEATGKGLVEFTFLLAMPALLFRAVVTADIGETQPALLLSAYFLSVAVVWVAAALLCELVLRRPRPEGAVFAMTASYGNIILLGIPIALSAFGNAAAPAAAVIVSTHIVTLWLAACLHLALVERSGEVTVAGFLQSVFVELARNPIVVAIALGALWRQTGLGLLPELDKLMLFLAQAGVPCALVAVGFSLAQLKIGGEVRMLALGLALKNVVLPAIAWWMTLEVFGLPALHAAVIILFCAMPTGTATYLFATRSRLAVETTSAAVALSTALSMLTVPVLLMLLL